MQNLTLNQYFEEHNLLVKNTLNALSVKIELVSKLLLTTLRSGNTIFLFGNGGSASQASHFAGELIGRFKKNRHPLPALSLNADTATITCIANDFGYENIYARQLEALIKPNDVAIGFSTSGTSVNVLKALEVARKKEGVSILLTGNRTVDVVTHCLSIPSATTAHIQEMHLMLIHYWCQEIDNAF